jgi:hypothetical protein
MEQMLHVIICHKHSNQDFKSAANMLNINMRQRHCSALSRMLNDRRCGRWNRELPEATVAPANVAQ